MAALRAALPALHLQGLPMAFHASFAEASEPITGYSELARAGSAEYARLADLLIANGVWVARRGIWYVSAAHTHADIAETMDRARVAFTEFAATA